MTLDDLLVRDALPDFALRIGIRALLRQRLREEQAGTPEESRARFARFVEARTRGPIAVHTQLANEQHYEVPTEFFQLVLGPRLKYSSAYWPEGTEGLAQAEEAMLDLTCRRARIADGQKILDLGCGWGSLSLWIAERYPECEVVSVSNSESQRDAIIAECRRRGFDRVEVRRRDIGDFDPAERFDRVVSIEMFEHMRNWDQLFANIASWLTPEGALFIHVFCHERFAYEYEDRGPSDWMARHFFTGGIMPSADLPLRFQRNFDVVEEWRVGGLHYARTCEAWLANMTSARARVLELFETTYGAPDVTRWWVYWRVFFLACAELFRFRGGREWMVGHYRFEVRS